MTPITNRNGCVGNHTQQPHETGTDLTGRDRLVSNVVFNWAGHFAFIVAGFILPRMIDRRLGQELLGVWDFGWSLVSYFFMVEAGISGAVSRYVAKFRMEEDTTAVNQIVSSGSCVLGVAGMLVLGLVIVFSLLLPQLFGTRLGENGHIAQWVVFFLGASLAVQVSLAAFDGVLTGCHRWALQNLVFSGWHAATVAGMIIALLLGGGLRSLSIIACGGVVLTYVTILMLAYWVFDGLSFRLSLVRWRLIKDLYVFGGKSLIPMVSRMLLNQTTSILIVAYLGPAMLALYSRPRSLILHVDQLVQKMARVLTPTVSSLQCSKSFEEIRELLTKSVQYAFYMVLPIVVVLVFFGGTVIQLWMGPRYANGLIPALLAVGLLIPISQTPATRILVGLNAHGRAGVADFIASTCTAGLVLLVLGYLKWGLVGVVLAVTIPITLMHVVYLPLLVSRRVGVDLWSYFTSVVVKPVILVLPFAICLMVAKGVFVDRALVGLMVGGTTGGGILAILYWRYVLPDRIKTWVFCGFRTLTRLAGFRSSTDTAA